MLIDIQNSNHVTTWKFPAGEVGVRLTDAVQSVLYSLENAEIQLKAKLNTSDEIMQMLMVVDAIRKHPNKSISLLAYYFPYARQDRVCNKGEAFSIKVIAQLINSLNFASVTIFDPHSDITPALIDRVKVLDCTYLAQQIKYGKGISANSILVSPDFGATKRLNKISKVLWNNSVLQFEKTRNQLTGEITGIDTVTGYCDFGGKQFIIFDDICDGGRTFIEIAKKLKAGGASEVILAVSHGIFSAGLDPIFKGGIDQIFTTDSYSKRDLVVWHPINGQINPSTNSSRFIQFSLGE